METLRDMTLAYLKSRRQFGSAIGSFQALQHRMVDIAVACEEARSMTYYATLRLAADPPVGACGVGGKSASRSDGPVRWPGVSAASRRRGDIGRADGKPSPQAPDDDRSCLRQCRSSPCAVRGLRVNRRFTSQECIGEAAIHCQHLSRDEIGGVRGEKKRCGGDVAGLAKAVQRCS